MTDQPPTDATPPTPPVTYAAPGTPDPATDGQRKMLAAYELSRALFEAERLGPQATALRWAREHKPGRTLPTMALDLVGSLGRLAGGATIGDAAPPSIPTMMNGWLSALWHIGLIAGHFRLAVTPLLTVCDDLAIEVFEGLKQPGQVPPSLIGSCVGLAVIATASENGPKTPEDANALRQATFGELGQITTVAIVAAIRNLRGWEGTMTIETFYTAAVETVTGREDHRR